jgi:uncharacterized protein (DUF885 family)
MKALTRYLSIALLVVSCCYQLILPTVTFGQTAKSVKTGSVSSTDRKASEEAYLNDFNPPQSEMRGVIERYVADRGNLNRFYTVVNSKSRNNRLKQFFDEWLATLAKLNFDTMGEDGKIDYILFKNYLDHEMRQLDIQTKAYTEVELLLPFAQTVMGFEEARRRMEKIDAPKTAALLNQLNKQVAETQKSLETSLKSEPNKIKKTVANRAAVTLNGLRTTLRNWYGFYNGYDPMFSWWVSEPYKNTDQLLTAYATFLREKVVGVKANDDTAIVGNPIGREALMSELAYEMIPYTPEELIAIANKEYDWCEAEMKKASQALGYGDDWLKAVEYVKTLYVEPGKQPELIKELALEAINFVDQHNLVTVPQLARDTWRMEMMSPEQQLVSPFFLGGEVIQVSYPTSGMTHEQKMMSMRGNNPHFSRATVHHELIPGHHLQGFMTARYRTHRNLFSTPFWGEGWALYWEMLLWDMNFPKTPEQKIGMLFWRMHRCARIIFSLSFHLEKMTPQECIDLLVKRVGHEVDNATAEVRRSFAGNYGPLYQCAYMLGGLQIRSLHRDLVESGKMTNRAFHDAVLKENRIPIEMIRADLTNQKLTRDFTSSWKFYGANPAGR